MKYQDKIDRVIDTAVDQKRINSDSKGKIEFAKSVFIDLLNKTDGLSLAQIKDKAVSGKIGRTEVTDEMLKVLLQLRETIDANPELRKSRRKRTRNTSEILKQRKAEIDSLYAALLADAPAQIKVGGKKCEARVEMRVMYEENGKLRIRTIPAALHHIQVQK
ncbi:hypothetical protein [Spirochaeta dissipatitropha]